MNQPAHTRAAVAVLLAASHGQVVPQLTPSLLPTDGAGRSHLTRPPRPAMLYVICAEVVCLAEETLKAGGPFYLVSMPGGVKDPTQGVNV